MDSSELLNHLTSLANSDNPVLAKIMGVFLTVLVFVLVIATIVDVVKKVKDVLSSTITDLISSEKNATNKVKTDDIKKRIRLDKVLNDVLSDAVQDNNLDRALLFQFHNGITSKSGISFEHLRLTHEATAPGVAQSTLGYNSVDIRLFYQILKPMVLEESNIVNMNIDEIVDPIKTLMNENGDGKFIAKILNDAITDITIGMIIFTRSSSEEDFNDDSYKSITRCADICSGVLSSTWGFCAQCEHKNAKGSKKCKKSEQKKNTDGNCPRYIPNLNLLTNK